MSKFKRIFFLLLVLSFFSLYQETIYAKEQTFEIKMIKNGFLPSNIQIKSGDTINFINKDEIDRWPASNIHPTHSIYPEFDPTKPIPPGKEWQFQFKRTGNFRFHDHLNPDLTGTIIVTGSDKIPVQTKINQNLKETITILYKKLYYKFFPKKLAEDLKAFNAIEAASDENKLKYWIQIIGGQKYIQKMVADSEGGTKVDCHQEAHSVGRAAYKIEGSQVFRAMDYNCHSGFLHGAMEAFIADKGGKDLIKNVINLCNDFKTDYSHFECLHGIGHGFTAYMDYDIPKALSLCKELDTDYARRSCFGGVFMENILVAEGKGAIKAHKTNWVSDDPHFPCDGVDKDYLLQYECYQMQTSRMLDISKYDFEFVHKECLKAPKDMIEVCFKSMGRDIAGQTLRDPVKITNLCQSVPLQYFKNCITGALNVVVEFWGENIASQPSEVCKRLSQDEKSFCYNLLGFRLKDIFGKNVAKIKAICEYGEKEFVNTCLNGTS